MRIVIAGRGPMAYFLARRFVGKNFHVAVITDDEVEAKRMTRDLKVRVLLGDGTTPGLLRDAEATRADTFLALLPRDEDNLIACQVARRMFQVPRVVSLIHDPGNVELFERLGVEATFSATELLAQVIEEQISTSAVMSLLPLAGGRAHVTEVVLPAHVPAAGRQIRELDIPAGALIASVFRADHLLIPGGETRLEPGDRLVLISQPEDYGSLLRRLLGEDA